VTCWRLWRSREARAAVDFVRWKRWKGEGNIFVGRLWRAGEGGFEWLRVGEWQGDVGREKQQDRRNSSTQQMLNLISDAG